MAGNSIILHRAPVSIKKSKATLESLLSTVERGFAAVADDITDIKSKMATNDDINSLDTKLTKFEEREIDKRLLHLVAHLPPRVLGEANSARLGDPLQSRRHVDAVA